MLSKCIAAAAHSVHNPFRRVGVSAAELFMDLTRPYKVAKALSTTPLYCGVSRGVNSNPMCASPVVAFILERLVLSHSIASNVLHNDFVFLVKVLQEWDNFVGQFAFLFQKHTPFHARMLVNDETPEFGSSKASLFYARYIHE